jgi:hypothetical protein
MAGGPERIDDQLQVTVAHPAARILCGGAADRVLVRRRIRVRQRDQQAGAGDGDGGGSLLGPVEVVQRPLAHGAGRQESIAGRGDLPPELLQLGREPVTGGRVALDVRDQRGAHLLTSLGARRGLAVGDRDEQAGHDHRERHERASPPPRPDGDVVGPLGRGLRVRGVEGLGEDGVQEGGAHRPRPPTARGSRHRAVRVAGTARSARTMPATWIR